MDQAELTTILQQLCARPSGMLSTLTAANGQDDYDAFQKTLEQNPTLMFFAAAFTLFVLLFLALSLATWVLIIRRLVMHQPILPVLPQRPRVWGLADVLLIALTVVVSQGVFAAIAVQLLGLDMDGFRKGTESMPLSLAMIVGIGNAVALAMGMVWIMARFQVPLSELGFTTQRMGRSLWYGLLAGLATIPVVYMLMYVVSLGLETEYDHPLIKAMADSGTFAAYLMGFVTAAIIAPLTEEVAFRVLIQGWLQSLSFRPLIASLFGSGWPLPREAWGVGLATKEHAQEHTDAPELTRDNTVGSVPDNPFAVPNQSGDGRSEHSLESASGPVASGQTDSGQSHSEQFESEQFESEAGLDGTVAGATSGSGHDSVSRVSSSLHDPYHSPAPIAEMSAGSGAAMQDEVIPPIWPSIVTGTLFGLAHWGYGLSFIPLILLGIVLGLVYRATNSVWPCILIHFMLNALSMIALGLAILSGQAQ